MTTTHLFLSQGALLQSIKALDPFQRIHHLDDLHHWYLTRGLYIDLKWGAFSRDESVRDMAWRVCFFSTFRYKS